MSDREAEFTHCSTDYVAVPAKEHAKCIDCAFMKEKCSGIGLPSCHAETRQDKTSKIFVKK